MYRIYPQTKFNPSSSLLNGLNQATSINAIPTTMGKSSQNDINFQLPPRPTSSTRPTVANSILKSSVAQWHSSDNHNELRTSSSASFLDDVRRVVTKIDSNIFSKRLFSG